MDSSVKTVKRIVPTTDEFLDSTEALDHIVCCLGPLDTALCGADVTNHPVALVVDNLCVRCFDIRKTKLQALGAWDPEPEDPICFETGKLCPGEEYVWELLLSRPG